jgi:tellurite resistance protein
MALRDDRSSGSLSKHEAFAGILLAASASDGEIADEELDSLCTTICRMRMFSSWSVDRTVEMMRRLLGMIVDDGVDAVLQRCARSLPEELRKTVFINACDLIMADGVVEEEEKQYVNRLYKALGISPDDAKTIAQIMVLKNRG